MREKLTDRLAAKAAPGLYFDTDPRSPRGFLLRVTPAGSRAWCLNYRVKDTGRERRLTIGDIGSWPIIKAKERAAELRQDIDRGGDPLADAEERRDAPTVADLWKRFIAEKLSSRAPSTQAEYKAMWRDYIEPAIGRKKLAAVESTDIDRLHRKLAEKPRRANTVLSLVSVLFNQGIAWKLCTGNPAQHVEKNAEYGRERFLTDEEAERLVAVLEGWPRRDSADAVMLALLTGARRGEILSATWEQFDLDEGVWLKPHQTTKQRKPHRAPLSDEAVALLRRRLAERSGKVVRLREVDRVFPTTLDGRLERDWRVIRAAAGLRDVRFHDMRHSYASMLAGKGYSLPIIGALLGHSRPSTTARYAHLHDKPLRAATGDIGKIIGGKQRSK